MTCSAVDKSERPSGPGADLCGFPRARPPEVGGTTYSQETEIDQAACKPGSVHRPLRKASGWATIPLGRSSRTASRNQPGRKRSGAPVPAFAGTPVPIRSCSRRGLPCHPCFQERGALLPHPFTLTFRRTGRRFAFCGALPRVGGLSTISPGGRYPPPCHRGARTFLQLPVQGPTTSGRPAA